MGAGVGAGGVSPTVAGCRVGAEVSAVVSVGTTPVTVIRSGWTGLSPLQGRRRRIGGG